MPTGKKPSSLKTQTDETTAVPAKAQSDATDGPASANRLKQRADVPMASDAVSETTVKPEGRVVADSKDKAEDAAVLVVGIGASAGGLEAFRQLLSKLPEKTGMAFVLIQHLDPLHESLLTALLSEATKLPVMEARDDLAVRPDHVYVIPPNCALGIEHGVLKVSGRVSDRGRHLPVDHFLRTLAADRGARAIGVVLSGAGSDGTLGLKSIAAVGGITFAQDIGSAAYSGMPGSAVAAGCVDLVLPPARIASELAYIARHPGMSRDRRKDAPDMGDSGEHLSTIFALLRSRTGNDFSHYKRNTVSRRIRRRMMVHKLDRLRDYARYLQSTPTEIEHLFDDLLINVTAFFRDAEVFDALRAQIFPGILEKTADDLPVRIWVPGCSSGEEPYSLAMTILEYLGERAMNPQVQIFATDIDAKAIAAARAGIYPERIIEDVSQSRLRRFFVKVAGGFQVSRVVRDMCVFAVQNLTKDPPFSRLDLVCCRNLLIYLGPVLQQHVLRVFHYALLPNGFLMLGTSESVGSHADLFSMLDKKSKIYGKKSIAGRLNYDFSTQAFAQDDPGMEPVARDLSYPPRDLQQRADRLVLSDYGPPGVIVNAEMDILQFRGETGQYLNPVPGNASLNLLKLARRELSAELRAVVHQAGKKGVAVRKDSVYYRRNGSEAMVNIRVMPMQDAVSGERNLLVLFEEVLLPSAAPGQGAVSGGTAETAKDSRIAELQRELDATREFMQSVIEDKEGTNEELKSANEEIQSTNEELQSINEELETAKEELQSTNEELATVNEELENRNADLAVSNNDLTNLLSNGNLPILMLGCDMRIRQFTPQAEKLLNLIAADLGRPISNIKSNIEIPALESTVRQVVDSMAPQELELKDRQGHWYSVRIRPYKTIDNRIDGVVITFVGVEQIRDLERIRRILAAEQRFASLMRNARDAIIVQDFDGAILAWNPAATRHYGYTADDALSMSMRQIVNDSEYDAYLRLLAGQRCGEGFERLEAERLCKSGERCRVRLDSMALVDDQGVCYAVATIERRLPDAAAASQ